MYKLWFILFIERIKLVSNFDCPWDLCNQIGRSVNLISNRSIYCFINYKEYIPISYNYDYKFIYFHWAPISGNINFSITKYLIFNFQFSLMIIIVWYYLYMQFIYYSNCSSTILIAKSYYLYLNWFSINRIKKLYRNYFLMILHFIKVCFMMNMKNWETMSRNTYAFEKVNEEV